MPKKTPQPQAEAISVWDAAEEEEFEMFGDEIDAGMSVAVASEITGPNATHLEGRMAVLENAVSQILTLLEANPPTTEPQ